jgi:uncharacterized protein (TIGR01777 family)
MRIFVTGGTGLIGTRLIRRLQERGDHVVLLTRRPAVAYDRLGGHGTVLEGDPMKEGPWMEAIADCDGVINLAGESIHARRWNDEFKKLLHDSRVQTTENVVRALARQPRTKHGSLKVLINGSAIGYYGPHGDEEITEQSPPGSDFLARVAIDWEKAAQAAESAGVRVAVIRTGVVLDKEGGALGQMLTPFKLGMGGPVASGAQWMSWIHHEDIVRIILLALDHDNASGPINGTAPKPETNKAFSKALGRALHRPAFMPVPGFMIRLCFGQVAKVLTTGQRVLPRRALALGYQFTFPDIDAALADIFAEPATVTGHPT